METKFEQRGSPQVTGFVSCVIPSDELPLYEQAAQGTGFGLFVTAKEGQRHSFWLTRGLEEGLETVIIGKGFLGINITSPVGQENYSAFWEEYRKLQAAQNPPK